MSKKSLDEKTKRHEGLSKEYVASVEKLEDSEKKEIKALWTQYTTARMEFERDYSLFSDMTTDFQQQLRILLKAKGKTALEIAEEVGISPKTLSRYNHGAHAPSMPTLIAICMALGLDIKQSTALLTTLGFCFLGTSREHYAYMRLIEQHRGASIEECNRILTGLHIDKKYQLYPRKAKQEE